MHFVGRGKAFRGKKTGHLEKIANSVFIHGHLVHRSIRKRFSLSDVRCHCCRRAESTAAISGGEERSSTLPR